MKRTIVVSGLLLLWVSLVAVAQEPPKAVGKPVQVDPVVGVAERVAKAEAAAASFRLELSTKGRMPGGLEVTTRGELRVLRGTQPDAPPKLYSRLAYSFGEGLNGQVESAQTVAGVMMFEEEPAFGAVLLHFAPAVVADLEWAGEVLQRSDLPGMADSRAKTPLGSQLLRELGRTFDFTEGVGEWQDMAGVWLRGKRKSGLDDQDPDLPMAERVEVFVANEPSALRCANYFVGEEVVQEIKVDVLEVGVELNEQAFVVDARDLRPREVQLYQPMWEQIEQTLQRAEAKAKEGQVRPSKR